MLLTSHIYDLAKILKLALMGSQPPIHKRLIVCCDGTWLNSDNGYNEPTIEHPLPTLQVPSNVTRISRCFKRRCNDGTLQVMAYESGVGTGSNAIDTFTGGAFGLGLSEAREEIHLLVFSSQTEGN